MDTGLISQKLESLRRCLMRLHGKYPLTWEALASDPDLQDIVVLNLTRAIQLSVDIGSHLISHSEQAAPATMGETFAVLQKMQILDAPTAETLRKAVGFRNIAVHNYEAVSWQIVHSLCTNQLDVSQRFAVRVADYCRL